MSKLIVCNTYFQLIMAIQLKETLFQAENVDLWLTDHSNGAESVTEKLRESGLFASVEYVKNRSEDYAKSKITLIKNTVELSIGKHHKKKYKEYEEIIFNGLTIGIYDIFDYYQTINHSCRWSMMEEGILSYNQNFVFGNRIKITSFIRNKLTRPDVIPLIENFYCFYPYIYTGKLKSCAVPVISAFSNCVKNLQNIFSLEEKQLNYSEKYIFFTSVYDFEGDKPIGEYELVCKIAEVVGKENLLIKIHPRDTRSLYADNGFKVDSNSSIPWEVIQLTQDFSCKVFLTATSGSVLAGSLMSEKPTRTCYMYPLCNIKGNPSAQKSAQDIYQLIHNSQMKTVLKSVSIVHSIEEILS